MGLLLIFSGVPAGAAFTGTGAVTLGGVAVDGTGTNVQHATATGAVTLGGVTVAGTGTNVQHATATGAVTLGGVTVAGTGTHTAPTFTATGAVTFGGLTVAGTGTHTAPTFTATGAVTLGGLASDGTGTHTAPTFTATGAVDLGGLTVDGIGSHSPVGTIGGSGSVTFGGLEVVGSGTSTQHVTGTGSITLAGLGVSGSGTRTSPTKTATGAVTFGGLAVAGTGTQTVSTMTATGAVSLGGISVAGTGTLSVVTPTATGAISLGGVRVSGVGHHTQHVTGTGAITLGGLRVASSPTTPPVVVTGIGYFGYTYYFVSFGGEAPPAPTTPTVGSYWAADYFPQEFFTSHYWSGTSQHPVGHVIATDLATLLLAIANRLVTNGGLNVDQVAISLEEWPAPAVGDTFAYLSPGSFRSIIPHENGGGRYVTSALGSVLVRLFTRNALDRAQEDIQRLTHTTAGSIKKAHRLVNALQCYMPEDSLGNILVEEPMFWEDEGLPIRFHKSKEWIRTEARFSLQFLMDLDVSVDV